MQSDLVDYQPKKLLPDLMADLECRLSLGRLYYLTKLVHLGSVWPDS